MIIVSYKYSLQFKELEKVQCHEWNDWGFEQTQKPEKQ